MSNADNEIAPGVVVTGDMQEGFDEILTPEALAFVADLHRTFNARRKALLAERTARYARIREGEAPTLLSDTQEIRDGDWSVAAAPDDLNNRRVEITGPVDRKMMINALNSGANVFMADLEDANSPTWFNCVQGQLNLRDAVRRELAFHDPRKGKDYALNDQIATLLVRPRGWHLTESHVEIDGEPASASLFDFGLYFFHNAAAAIERGSGPYFYLPKLESHLEARLWNDVFNKAQDDLDIPRGTIRATVLIETILAAFEMDEILYELREHSAGLNAGRWDYIFSAIKKFRFDGDCVFPDRGQITMTVPFMRAYTERMVKTCHKRGAHAIGGMAAFIPSRRDAAVNEVAMAKVRADKEREAADGCDGSWVAHPDLVPLVRDVFNEVMGDAPHQKDTRVNDAFDAPDKLIDFAIEGGTITRAGVELNVSIAIQYLAYWLEGIGAVALNNLMEDAATAEISRAQLWQWVHHGAVLNDSGETLNADLYQKIRTEQLEALHDDSEIPFDKAAELLDQLVLDEDFIDFLTLLAYPELG